MKLFEFFKRKEKTEQKTEPVKVEVDRSLWTGKDFEFLIMGNIEIPSERFDEIMTPNSFEWTKILKDDWVYYQAGEDEFTYSWEIPGIQMTFNDSISYQKAKQIADEVIENIKATKQKVKLVVIDNQMLVKF